MSSTVLPYIIVLFFSLLSSSTQSERIMGEQPDKQQSIKKYLRCKEHCFMGVYGLGATNKTPTEIYNLLNNYGIDEFIRNVPWNIFIQTHKLMYGFKKSQCNKDECDTLPEYIYPGINEVVNKLNEAIYYQVQLNSHSLVHDVLKTIAKTLNTTIDSNNVKPVFNMSVYQLF